MYRMTAMAVEREDLSHLTTSSSRSLVVARRSRRRVSHILLTKNYKKKLAHWCECRKRASTHTSGAFFPDFFSHSFPLFSLE
jgi:hypothetical protein